MFDFVISFINTPIGILVLIFCFFGFLRDFISLARRLFGDHHGKCN